MILDAIAFGLALGVVSAAVGIVLILVDEALWRRKWKRRRQRLSDE